MVRCVSLLLRPRTDLLVLARCGAPGSKPLTAGSLFGSYNPAYGTAELGPSAHLAHSFGHEAERRCLPRGHCGVDAVVAEAARDASDLLALQARPSGDQPNPGGSGAAAGCSRQRGGGGSQVPPGRQLPASFESALAAAPCAVLLFRAAPGAPGSGDDGDEAQLRAVRG